MTYQFFRASLKSFVECHHHNPIDIATTTPPSIMVRMQEPYYNASGLTTRQT